jgi:SAM-dependent methyltransferase
VVPGGRNWEDQRWLRDVDAWRLSMDAPEAGYQLGSDAAELERLNRQGRVLAPATRMLLQAAGIGPGMRVLDLGSGTGDVAFLATAKARTQQRGLGNVRFVVGDIMRRPRAVPSTPSSAAWC